jgi:hypothetical protein
MSKPKSRHGSRPCTPCAVCRVRAGNPFFCSDGCEVLALIEGKLTDCRCDRLAADKIDARHDGGHAIHIPPSGPSFGAATQAPQVASPTAPSLAA